MPFSNKAFSAAVQECGTRLAQSGDPSPGKGYVGFEPYSGD